MLANPRALAVALTVHFFGCRRHAIEAWTPEPWERYRELRGWRR